MKGTKWLQIPLVLQVEYETLPQDHQWAGELIINQVFLGEADVTEHLGDLNFSAIRDQIRSANG